MTAARPTSPRAASAASVGIDATSSGVRPPELVERLVGTAVGHADHVLHGRRAYGWPGDRSEPTAWTGS